MKKIKCLVPILGLTAVAPITISLTSCGPIKGHKIELKLVKEEEPDEDQGWFQFESDSLTLKKDSIYTIVADLSALKFFTETDGLVISAANKPVNEEEGLEEYIDVQKFIVNGKTLQEITSPEAMAEGGWDIFDEYLCALPKSGETFKTKGKVYVIFKAKKDSPQPFKIVLANES